MKPRKVTFSDGTEVEFKREKRLRKRKLPKALRKYCFKKGHK